MDKILVSGYQLCLAVILGIIISVLGAGDNYYRAAVLESIQFTDMTYPFKEVIKRNLDVYEAAAKTASLHEVDIIVFPECGLIPCEKANRSYMQTFVEDIPNPKTGFINPCCQEDKFKDSLYLRKLSCMAKEYKLFIVANTMDFKKCEVTESCDADGFDDCPSKESACPDDGSLFYNTNVVFDRDGTLVSRYYKKHLYFELDMNTPHFAQDATFDTDFGKFSTVICFDLMFKESVEEVEKPAINNLAYPTYWFDHLPFVFFASSYQQAWAMSNRINLLAANAHTPATGTLGSGIYSANKGALIYTHNPDFRTKLLISNVPKSVGAESSGDFELNAKKFFIENGAAIEEEGEEKRNFKSECTTNILGEAKGTMDSYRCNSANLDTYEFSKLDEKEGTKELCSNGFCCSLTYEADSMDESYFLAVSGKPLNFYNAFSYGSQSCFLARCESSDGRPCKNFILKSHTVFRKVDIKASFSTRYVYPFAMDSEVRLTDRKDWVFNRKSQILYENLSKTSLIFIGLYGRIYDDDKVL